MSASSASDLSKQSAQNLRFYLFFAAIVVVASLLRSYDLVSRPLHNDEGVNFFFLQGITKAGYYEYSHENYHGPAYFYWSYFWFYLFGENEIGVRGAAAITGVLTLFLLLPLRRTDGDRFVLAASLLLALSPSHVYYSRYAIHETLFVLASLGIAVSLYLWWRLGFARYVLWAWGYLALLIATKETFVISLFCLGLASFALSDRGKLWQRIQAQRDTLIRRIIPILALTMIFGWVINLPSAGSAILHDSEKFSLSVALFLATLSAIIYFSFIPLGKLAERILVPGSLVVSLLAAYLVRGWGPQFSLFGFLLVVSLASFWLWGLIQTSFSFYLAAIAAGLLSGLAGPELAIKLGGGVSGTIAAFALLLSIPALALLPLGEYLPVLRRLVQHIPAQFLGALLCFFLVALCFTGGFQWSKGLDELLQGVPQWVGRNDSDTGHFKPFWYYATKVIFPAEPWLLGLPFLVVVCAALALYVAKWQQGISTHLARFCTVWTILSFLVYSVLNYKTAWLIINITTPAVLALAAWGAIIFACLPLARLPILALGCLIAFASSWLTCKYNFVTTFGKKNPFSYVHTSQGMIDLVNDTNHYREFHPKSRILIGVGGYWPLPFYYRDYAERVGYILVKEPEQYTDEYDILIIDKTVRWHPPADKWVKKYYRLSEVQETYTYFFRGKR